jgi:hypothetical protein
VRGTEKEGFSLCLSLNLALFAVGLQKCILDEVFLSEKEPSSKPGKMQNYGLTNFKICSLSYSVECSQKKGIITKKALLLNGVLSCNTVDIFLDV